MNFYPYVYFLYFLEADVKNFFKKSMVLLLVTVIVFSSTLSIIAAEVSHKTDKDVIAAGEDVTVTITLDETLEGVTSFEFYLYFDANLFTLKSSENGTAHDDMEISKLKTDRAGDPYYSVNFVDTESEGVVINAGTVYTLVFTATEEITGNVDATFKLVNKGVVDADWSDIPVTVGEDITVTVGTVVTVPETAAEIVAAAYALADGEVLPYEATLTGVITKVDTPYSESYNNITVTIAVEGCEEYPIMCYRLKGEGADTLAVGDTITVTGTIKNYRGTIEFDSGCNLDAVVKGEQDVPTAPEDPAEIVAAAYALADGESLPYEATLTGVIIKVDTPYSESYNNITVTIAVEGCEEYPIMCYRLKGEGVDTLAVGDTITVTGIIKNYRGTIEFDSGCALNAVVKHAHDYTSEVTKSPSCEENGVVTYTCSICGHSYTEETSAMGHAHGDWVVTTEPTCTEEGVKTSTCSACGDEITEAVAALGHTYGEWVVTTEPTCTEEGVKTSTCSACEDEITEAVEALGHTYEWAVTIEPTCTEEGLATGTCSACGDEITEVVAALGHSYGAWVIVTAPTTTEVGERTKTCDACGDVITEVIPVIPATQEEIVDGAYDLGEGESLPYEATITGVITEVEEVGEFIMVTFQIAGSNAKPIVCYYAKADLPETLEAGDTLTITGILKNEGGTIEFEAGATLDEIVKVEAPQTGDGAAILVVLMLAALMTGAVAFRSKKSVRR